MKILTTKKYNHLIEDKEELEKENRNLRDEIKDLQAKVEDKKTSCKANKGSDFCFSCKNSYRYKTYWGVAEYEKAACLLDVACEDFERKEVAE